MAELALANGCIAEEPVSISRYPTPLFMICTLTDAKIKVTEQQCAETIQHLLNAGYNKEYRNSDKCTPLLYTAIHFSPLSLTMMRLLLGKGADLHAVDDQRRTALHLCLLFLRPLGVCRHSTRPRYEQAIAEGIHVTKPYDIDDAKEDAYPNEAYSDQKAEDEADEYGSNAPCSFPDSPQSYCIDENHTSHAENLISRYCEVRDIDDFKLPHHTSCDNELDCDPEPWMFKARLRLKLLVLLKAGCDPNALDSDGQSATDYAPKEGLIPQWEWALANSGWEYNGDIAKYKRQDTGTCEDGDALP
jgi:hypothetical protein